MLHAAASTLQVTAMAQPSRRGWAGATARRGTSPPRAAQASTRGWRGLHTHARRAQHMRPPAHPKPSRTHVRTTGTRRRRLAQRCPLSCSSPHSKLWRRTQRASSAAWAAWAESAEPVAAPCTHVVQKRHQTGSSGTERPSGSAELALTRTHPRAPPRAASPRHAALTPPAPPPPAPCAPPARPRCAKPPAPAAPPPPRWPPPRPRWWSAPRPGGSVPGAARSAPGP